MSSSSRFPAIVPLGDAAVLVSLGELADREISRRVHAHVAATKAARLAGTTDVVPGYSSFAVHFDPSMTGADEISASLREIVATPVASEHGAFSQLITISVNYDGPDLQSVAEATGLAIDDLIARHCAPEYYAYMTGFAPGFAYLGDVDPALRLPRRETPRTRVPRGSVAIAGSQTAVYPIETPGGWHLIGSTEMCMFDSAREPPAILRAGDRVKFERIA